MFRFDPAEYCVRTTLLKVQLLATKYYFSQDKWKLCRSYAKVKKEVGIKAVLTIKSCERFKFIYASTLPF